MILVDSSVWINHLRVQDHRLAALVEAREVLGHPGVVGELAVGNLARRRPFLFALMKLPQTIVASHAETLAFIEHHQIHGRGIGYIDAQLLASTRLTREARFWTTDRRLAAVTSELGLAAVLDY